MIEKAHKVGKMGILAKNLSRISLVPWDTMQVSSSLKCILNGLACRDFVETL